MIDMRAYSFILASFLIAAPMVAHAEGKHDTNKPISINSDSLEVYQQENKATFIGHVVAVQGEVHLKADKMTVHYRQQSGGSKKSDSSGSQGAIDRIEVEGNVFMSTPEETASGDHGVYLVSDKNIDLKDNVVLTRGKNVLKGDHLVYNMETGKSVVSSGKGVATQTSGGKKERVRALFVPDSEKKK